MRRQPFEAGGIPVSLETIVFKINMLSYIINLTKIKIWKIPKIARSCRFRRNCKSSLFAAPSLKTRFPTHIEEQFLPQAQSIRNVFSIFNILMVNVLLSESQCKDTTFHFPNSPMLIVAQRYSPIITDKYQGSPKWKKI